MTNSLFLIEEGVCYVYRLHYTRFIIKMEYQS